jgi:chemotaxis protein MotB
MGSTASVPVDDPLGLMPDPVDPELELVNPGLTDGATLSPVDGETDGDDYIDVFAEAYMDMIEERLTALVAEAGLDSSTVEVVVEEEGVYLRIRDAALFPTAQAALSPEGQALVLSLSEITRGLEIPTIVSGHADARPIRTAAFPSNWELSAARAAGVARLLVASGQAPETLRVQSFGEFQPVADNETADGRAKNRRVELFFSRDAIRDMALRLQEGPGT